jgi:hypothetical protein
MNKSEKESTNSIPFTIASKELKYLRINLTEEITDYTMKITSH